MANSDGTDIVSCTIMLSIIRTNLEAMTRSKIVLPTECKLCIKSALGDEKKYQTFNNNRPASRFKN